MTRIGQYRLYTIETGSFRLDGGAMFGVVPRPLWESRIAPDERNRIRLAMRCLLLESSDRLILIDNGLGHKYTEKFAGLYAVDHTESTLARSLAAVGFGTDEVTDVVLTHLHFDHAGGSTERVNDRLDVVFSNARHHVQRLQWATAVAPNPREAPSFLEENLKPIAESGRLELLDGEQSIFPGVTVRPVHGHTSAMQIVQIADETQTLVFVADLLPTSHHFGASWTMAYDVRPLESIAEKETFLAKAAKHGWSLFFEHDPVVAVTNVAETERGFRAIEARTLAEL